MRVRASRSKKVKQINMPRTSAGAFTVVQGGGEEAPARPASRVIPAAPKYATGPVARSCFYTPRLCPHAGRSIFVHHHFLARASLCGLDEVASMRSRHGTGRALAAPRTILERRAAAPRRKR
jgi:hypothetical protein